MSLSNFVLGALNERIYFRANSGHDRRFGSRLLLSAFFMADAGRGSCVETCARNARSSQNNRQKGGREARNRIIGYQKAGGFISIG
jgi:hypothetical protein